MLVGTGAGDAMAAGVASPFLAGFGLTGAAASPVGMGVGIAADGLAMDGAAAAISGSAAA